MMTIAFIVLHNTPRTMQLIPAAAFESVTRVTKLTRGHPLASKVNEAMRALMRIQKFANINTKRLTLKEMYDQAAGLGILPEGVTYLSPAPQYPARIIVKG